MREKYVFMREHKSLQRGQSLNIPYFSIWRYFHKMCSRVHRSSVGHASACWRYGSTPGTSWSSKLWALRSTSMAPSKIKIQTMKSECWEERPMWKPISNTPLWSCWHGSLSSVIFLPLIYGTLVPLSDFLKKNTLCHLHCMFPSAWQEWPHAQSQEQIMSMAKAAQKKS